MQIKLCGMIKCETNYVLSRRIWVFLWLQNTKWGNNEFSCNMVFSKPAVPNLLVPATCFMEDNLSWMGQRGGGRMASVLLACVLLTFSCVTLFLTGLRVGDPCSKQNNSNTVYIILFSHFICCFYKNGDYNR